MKPEKWYKPNETDYFFLGFIVFLFALMFFASTCTAQEQCDTLRRQNEQLRSTIKALPTEEILNLFETYDRLLRDCESTKDSIVLISTATFAENNKQLQLLKQLLQLSQAEVQNLKADLQQTRAELSAIRKGTKKARRYITFERIGTVVLSSIASIGLYSILTK